ncbi:hypothetical protein FKW77_005482 [Venturia effusa]|uniref:Intradiol ring-cleavage dioxygenases domain-containing protein n=1 Tax=Venturia effusa TaxID=50376 RepID=A0A517L1D1_9PEZI|nr:hypothetical protein FKW77_005482 [Venturia effusa]
MLAALPALTLAHPKDGAEVAKLLELHRRTAEVGMQALGQCSNSREALSSNQAAARGRVETLNAIRNTTGINPGTTAIANLGWNFIDNSVVQQLVFRSLQDLKHWEDKKVVNHDKTGQVGNSDNAWSTTKPQCVFVPEDTVGPYYYPRELVRSDMTEGLAGIPMWLDVQLINVNTCKPVQGMTVDIWAANAVGIYSHIPVEQGQAGKDTHWQRGALKTNNDGRAVFKMIFPGHYDGRATHVHVMARDAIHTNDSAGQPIVVGEEKDSNVHHIGQVYFDESLRAQFERQHPYDSNKQKRLSNDQDDFAKFQAGKQYDPFVNYIFVNGKDVAGGIYAWISIGIDPKASKGQNRWPKGRPW